jgi:cell division protein FtsB
MQPMNPQPQAEALPNKRRNRSISGAQVIFAIILAVVLMLAINFSSRVAADRELRQISAVVEREIETLRREQGELIQRLAYVQSEAYVETWARSEGRMVRDGEVLMVLYPSNNTQTITASAVATPIVVPPDEEPVQNWQLWWSLFFDSLPPNS